VYKFERVPLFLI